jgi:hypothetical protein
MGLIARTALRRFEFAAARESRRRRREASTKPLEPPTASLGAETPVARLLEASRTDKLAQRHHDSDPLNDRNKSNANASISTGQRSRKRRQVFLAASTSHRRLASSRSNGTGA